MFYLSIALLAITAVFAIRPPEFTFRKIIIVKHEVPVSDEEIDMGKLQEERPPSMDDVLEVVNTAIHDLTGGDDY